MPVAELHHHIAGVHRQRAAVQHEQALAFEQDWQSANGKAEEWYREDKLVKDVIGADGVYGIKGLNPPPPDKK